MFLGRILTDTTTSGQGLALRSSHRIPGGRGDQLEREERRRQEKRKERKEVEKRRKGREGGRKGRGQD
jgi:hypothetical protein